MQETMQEYLNFPDPQLYLVGFECPDACANCRRQRSAQIKNTIGTGFTAYKTGS
jgi:hypothetical protein